jgi:hypothetical protein
MAIHRTRWPTHATQIAADCCSDKHSSTAQQTHSYLLRMLHMDFAFGSFSYLCGLCL